MTTARQHHYLPQCYLKGFAPRRDRAKLFVVDLSDRRVFHTAPANVAVERDFHRIEVEGLPPDAMEKAFSAFESELSKALGRIISARSINNEHDRALLLNFIGMTAIKNPRLRETTRDFQERVSTMAMELMTETPERWEFTMQRAKEAGFTNDNPDVTFEEMRTFVRKGEYKLAMPPDAHLAMELQTFDKVLPLIFKRRWMLLRARPRMTGFITSDHPMCLVWSEPSKRGCFYSPGLGVARTEIVFPVSNELAVVGAFEAEDGEFDADESLIAHVNGVILAYASRQTYARDNDFVYKLNPEGKIMTGKTLRHNLASLRTSEA